MPGTVDYDYGFMMLVKIKEDINDRRRSKETIP